MSTRRLDIPRWILRILSMRRLNNFHLATVAVSLLVISVSLMGEVALMPDLTGMSVDSARVELSLLLGEAPDSLSLVVLPDSFYTDSIPEGFIAWQEPLPDSFIIDTIKVRMSAPFTIELPDLRGMEFKDAVALLDALDLKYAYVRDVESEEYPAGTIAVIYPEPGASVKRKEEISLVVSIGVPEYTSTPVETSEGIEIHLYEDPKFETSSVSVVSKDSAGFELEFKLKVSNPYKHSMTAEKLKFELQINRSRLLKDLSSDFSIKIPAKSTAYGKVRVRVSYTDILPSVAKFLLSEAEYRLVGTFALVTEKGFTRRDFETVRESDLFSSYPDIKEKLEEIAFSVKEED
jgi:LEA14-like dessication related protein